MTPIEQKQKELIEELDHYYLSKTIPSLDELNKVEGLKSEIAALERELPKTGAKDCQKAEEIAIDIRNLMFMINEQIEHPKDCFSMDLKALWNTLSDIVTKVDAMEEYRSAGMPSDFEIEAKFPILSNHQMDTASWNNSLRQDGAKWVLNKWKGE